MAAWTATARQAANMARLSSPKSASTAKPASLVHRRGLAAGGDHRGPPKVNFWEDPMHPSKWKEEHLDGGRLYMGVTSSSQKAKRTNRKRELKNGHTNFRGT